MESYNKLYTISLSPIFMKLKAKDIQKQGVYQNIFFTLTCALTAAFTVQEQKRTANKSKHKNPPQLVRHQYSPINAANAFRLTGHLY